MHLCVCGQAWVSGDPCLRQGRELWRDAKLTNWHQNFKSGIFSLPSFWKVYNFDLLHIILRLWNGFLENFHVKEPSMNFAIKNIFF